jgi:predicted porin
VRSHFKWLRTLLPTAEFPTNSESSEETVRMKRHIFLLPVLAISVNTHAQSTVSLSVTVDTYVQYSKGSIESRTGLGSGGNSTSKLIFRGSEDLGGGLRAGFWLESGFTADNGQGQATNTNNQPSGATPAAGLTFNRRSILYLAGPWGTLHLGRDWSPTYDTFTTRFDPFGVASGIGLNYTAGINPNGVRVSNAVTYITPKYAGFSANIQHWFGENQPGVANSNDGSGSGIKLDYERGSFGAVAAYARTNFATGDALYRNTAVAYSFGSIKVSANYNNDRQGTLKQEGALVGVRVPVGFGEIKASYSWFRTQVSGRQKAQKLAVGYVYHLSKRTAWYTTLARIDNSDGLALAINGSKTAPNRSSTGVDLGIRHNF